MSGVAVVEGSVHEEPGGGAIASSAGGRRGSRGGRGGGGMRDATKQVADPLKLVRDVEPNDASPVK
jgi:hypothetical protein